MNKSYSHCILRTPSKLTAISIIVFSQYCLSASVTEPDIEEDALIIKRSGLNCLQDANCFNRIHHEIPMNLRARPGQQIVFETRNTTDFNIDPNVTDNDPRRNDINGSTVHPITGPVYIEGTEAGDVLAVTIEKVIPGDHGITVILPIGFISDLFPQERYRINWQLDENWATTEAIPGVRIANAGFPGIVTVLPDAQRTASILVRERELAKAGGTVSLPEPVNASPAGLCGPDGRVKDQCLRTIPPREHGGNFDIRYLGSGVTIYMLCYVNGCGLGIVMCIMHKGTEKFQERPSKWTPQL